LRKKWYSWLEKKNIATRNSKWKLDKTNAITYKPIAFEKEPIEIQDVKKSTDLFRGIYKIYLKLVKQTKRSQHVTGWTWKHSDCDQWCPKHGVFPHAILWAIIIIWVQVVVYVGGSGWWLLCNCAWGSRGHPPVGIGCI